MFESLERSSFFGLCLVVGKSGDPGSFLTTILGPPAFRDLCAIETDRLVHVNQGFHIYHEIAYALGGDDLWAFEPAVVPLGLALSERVGGAAAFCVAEAVGGGGGIAAADLWAVGDDDVGGALSRPNEGLSCGAGEGAIATAVVMIDVRA
jgi:hypothetical protein